MIVISEWLPNPNGNDAQGEWVELVNTGNRAANVGGHQLAASKGKPYIFSSHTLAPGEHFVLHRSASKLTLRNTDETLTLTAPDGTVADISKFIGSAPEGKSLSRFGERFLFVVPTPGEPNALPQTAAAIENYPVGMIVAPISNLEWIAIALAVGIGLAAAITTIMVRNAALSHLFFGGDDTVGPGAR